MGVCYLAVRAANNPKATDCNEHECLSRAGPVAQKPTTASRNLVEFGQSRGSNRIRTFPRAVASAAGARRRCSGRARHARLRPPFGPAGGRRRARYKGGASQPGVAGHCCMRTEPQGSDLRIAESTRRGSKSHPYGIRPRLPFHWHIALECHRTRLPEAPGEQSRVLSSFVSAELPTIAPVRFQFELIAETQHQW